MSVEAALLERRSVRDFAPEPLTLTEVSQLLWAAQGITAAGTRRTAPSAGALYPLNVYLVSGSVSGLAAAVYRYQPKGHGLQLVVHGDHRRALAAAAAAQHWLGQGAVAIVVAADYGRTTRRYGERGRRYAHMEAGHVAQNIQLQAVALGLGSVVVGAFDDGRVKTLINLAESDQPLSIVPVGRRVRVTVPERPGS